MENCKIYEDIASRTNGDIYIGVVGPVRSGKSTFIKQFMESVVIPNIENVYKKERAKDELPQSASGKTIMTAEPKFVPEEAVELSFDNQAKFKVRLIDCVGYMIPGALGQLEGENPRMVTTPWFDHEISMGEAAEVGTRKVIAEHSTIGMVVTTDGSISDFSREDYLQSEERVINELKEINKPFLVVINSADPKSETAEAVKNEITEKYGVSCVVVNCLTMNQNDINELIKQVLYEFPVKEIEVKFSGWFDGLSAEHPIKVNLYNSMLENAKKITKVRDINNFVSAMSKLDNVSGAYLSEINLGQGTSALTVNLNENLFFDIIKENTGFDISNDGELIPLLAELSKIKKDYERFSGALEQVRQVGYSIVEPALDELKLEEPEIVKQGGQFGVRLRASAPSIHTDSIKQKYRFQKQSLCRNCVSADMNNITYK